MGAWGVAVFSDDLTADIRDDYRQLLLDRVPDAEATQRVIANTRPRLRPDNEHLLWIALAAAQNEVGRLDEEVKARALSAIADDLDNALWEGTGSEAARRAVLKRLAVKLSGPQPAKKRLRAPSVPAPTLAVGDVLMWISPVGTGLLLRVFEASVTRHGVHANVGALEWVGREVPELGTIARLPFATSLLEVAQPGHLLAPRTVHRFGPNDPDWADLGFSRVAEANALSGQDVKVPARPTRFSAWTAFEKSLREACLVLEQRGISSLGPNGRADSTTRSEALSPRRWWKRS